MFDIVLFKATIQK